MKIGIIGFTARGARLSLRLAGLLGSGKDACAAYVPERYLHTYLGGCEARRFEPPLGQWAGAMFREGRAMVFVGAAGIAVRAIAPFVRDKMTDPPVVVVDEAGRYAIPILSGHVGGANRLAMRIGDCLGAEPVITTATDVNGLFAVDVFAAANGLKITDRKAARQVSAWLLDGGDVGYVNDFWGCGEEGCAGTGGCGDVPKGRWPVPRGCSPGIRRYTIWITVKSSGRRPAGWEKWEGAGQVLRLVPRAVVAGVGCQRGVALDVLEQQVLEGFRKHGIDILSVRALATIDIKRDEAALLGLAGKYGWELRFYSAQDLREVRGCFSESGFVEQAVGVGNVCGRACAAGGGRILFDKEAGKGVTVAAAVEPVKIDIENFPQI